MVTERRQWIPGDRVGEARARNFKRMSGNLGSNEYVRCFDCSVGFIGL